MLSLPESHGTSRRAEDEGVLAGEPVRVSRGRLRAWHGTGQAAHDPVCSAVTLPTQPPANSPGKGGEGGPGARVLAPTWGTGMEDLAPGPGPAQP